MQKKFVQKMKNFEKPLTMPFQICKNFCKILNNLIFNQEKLKCKFPLTGCLQKSGSKQRFSLLQAKAFIQAVCLRTQAVSIKAWF